LAIAVLVVVVAMATASSWHAAMMVPVVVSAIVVVSMAGSVIVLSTEPPDALSCIEGVSPRGIPSKLPEALPVPFFLVLVVLKVFGIVDILLTLSLWGSAVG
jgi:hypothetical protein